MGFLEEAYFELKFHKNQKNASKWHFLAIGHKMKNFNHILGYHLPKFEVSRSKNSGGMGFLAEITKLLDFRSNPGLTSRFSELEIGSNNCPRGAFRSALLET